jgi:hypothetical protein
MAQRARQPESSITKAAATGKIELSCSDKILKTLQGLSGERLTGVVNFTLSSQKSKGNGQARPATTGTKHRSSKNDPLGKKMK